MHQLPLPLGALATRDEAYAAAIEAAGLPAAARRVARWMLEAGHPQRTAEGERLYAVAGGKFRELARRSGIPLSTLHGGMRALAEADLLARASGCYCLFVAALCELETHDSDAVPQAPTDDWGHVCLPRRRSPERPAAAETGLPRPACSEPFGSVRGSFGPVRVCSGSVRACSDSFPPGQASISARAPVVVVDLDLSTNNNPEPAAVKELARQAWSAMHASRKPPRPEPAARLLFLRCAWLALGTELGARWLLSAARARPLRGERLDPVRFFQAAAAYQAWERVAGEPAETDDERREARRQLRELLARVNLPRELLQRGGAP